MRTQLKSVSLLAICYLVALSGCARVNQSSSTPKGNTVQHGSGLPAALVSEASIQGSWKNTCTLDAKTHGYYTAVLNIQNAVMTSSTTSYADAACAYPIALEERVSSITIEAASDVTLLTEKLVTVKYTPLNAIMANLYNQNTYCGSSSWSANTAITITTAALCSGLQESLAFHAELYGSQELYLKDCATTDQTSCTVRYVKAAN